MLHKNTFMYVLCNVVITCSWAPRVLGILTIHMPNNFTFSLTTTASNCICIPQINLLLEESLSVTCNLHYINVQPTTREIMTESN